jgi:lysine 2,3-aminomutase
MQSDQSKIGPAEMQKMYERYQFTEEAKKIIETENLLPSGVMERLHSNFPQHSGFFRNDGVFFTDKNLYTGLKGFREIVEILKRNGIELGHLAEREFFIEVYRFMATRHVLNTINWSRLDTDTMYQLVFPQPGMIAMEEVQKYIDAATPEEKQKVVEAYTLKTNPHDGKQLLNKPWFTNEEGHLEILQGCQHKYPPVMLIFDKQTQNCFAFCTYCFRHAQVRGDLDMFVQEDVSQVHRYLRMHPEVSDILITGGDGGFITRDRLAEYVKPLMDDASLSHLKTVRFGSRALTFQPEMILTERFTGLLELMKDSINHGLQMLWVAHFSTPEEILNPATIAAIRRLKSYGVTVRSQSPIMNHVSLWMDENGKVDIERSAKNWIDLGNILGMLGVGFHSMYCARPTGEHHYFTAPLVDIHKIFTKVYQTLSSIYRPSRYITMTSSAGKISMLGPVDVDGETAFALKFNEARNMDWLNRIYLTEYDEKQNTIEKLKPFHADKNFFDDELKEIEAKMENALSGAIYKEEHYGE